MLFLGFCWYQQHFYICCGHGFKMRYYVNNDILIRQSETASHYDVVRDYANLWRKFYRLFLMRCANMRNNLCYLSGASLLVRR